MAIIMMLALALPFLALVLLIANKIKAKKTNLPPGSFGWPILGETLEFLRANRDGEPQRFIKERMEKHDSRVFKTWLLGEPMAFFCGTAGNKFLFGNENKKVMIWWPSSVQQLIGPSLSSMVGEEGKMVRKVLMGFVGPDALMRYTRVMDEVTRQHIKTQWEGKKEVKVYPTIKYYTFELACQLFMSLQDPNLISKLADDFKVLLKGLIEIPLNFPGTRFFYAMRAANSIRKQLRALIRARRVALDSTMASPPQDLLTHLLKTPDGNGKFMPEIEIINNILALIFAGHDTSSSAITMIMKFLAELPQVYERVLTEQVNIAKKKGEGEPLDWEDIQNMKYSWNVVSEVMRLWPPIPGTYREALVDFTYEGFTIPKGWKLSWNSASTHKDASIFPSSENFDASRFEGDGPAPYSYVPFGGGPRMCLGKEYARLEILVFLHYVVNKFKWELLIPDEKIIYDPVPTSITGLPIALKPHKSAV